MSGYRAQRKIPVDLHFIVRLRHKASGAALGLSCAVCFEQPAGVFAGCGAVCFIRHIILYRRRTEVPAETFAGAHPSGCRRHLPFTRSWVTTGLLPGPPSASQNPRGCFRRPEGPSKGSLALILPTIVGPSAHKAADGHAFRSAPETRALRSTDI